MGCQVTLKGELVFPSDYLTAVDLKGKDFTLRIKTVTIEDLHKKGAKTEPCPTLTFDKAKKKLVVNKTNATSIAMLHGKAMENWVGKEITIYPTKTRWGRETVDCIRVREPSARDAMRQREPEPVCSGVPDDALTGELPDLPPEEN